MYRNHQYEIRFKSLGKYTEDTGILYTPYTCNIGELYNKFDLAYKHTGVLINIDNSKKWYISSLNHLIHKDCDYFVFSIEDKDVITDHLLP